MILNELYAFLFATGISLYGSLMAGMVNVNVIYCALHQSKRHAKWMALGGVLPELLYSGVAIFGVELVRTNETLFEYLKYAVVPVLIGMGIYFILAGGKKSDIKEKEVSGHTSFWKGFILAMLNPQLITFWFGWLLIGYSFFDFEEYTFISPKITFVLGTAVGAYIMLRTFIFITVRHREKILGWMRIKVNVLVGWILISIGILQLIVTILQEYVDFKG